jgi:hypothetical protein
MPQRDRRNEPAFSSVTVDSEPDKLPRPAPSTRNRTTILRFEPQAIIGKPALPKRVSLWEIQRVYSFEVCSLTDAVACKAAPDSDWKPLDQFAP